MKNRAVTEKEILTEKKRNSWGWSHDLLAFLMLKQPPATLVQLQEYTPTKTLTVD